MGSGVVVYGDAVGCAGHNFAVFDYHGAKRAAAIAYALGGQSYGLPHKAFIIFGSRILHYKSDK